MLQDNGTCSGCSDLQYQEDQDILIPSQFGFRSSHSVLDQLGQTYKCITHEYDLGMIGKLIMFDFRKTFDLVPHNILIDKLACFGFKDPLVGWIHDFTHGLNMKMAVSGSSSSLSPVRYGARRALLLGLCFLLFLLIISPMAYTLIQICLQTILNYI